MNDPHDSTGPCCPPKPATAERCGPGCGQPPAPAEHPGSCCPVSAEAPCCPQKERTKGCGGHPPEGETSEGACSSQTAAVSCCPPAAETDWERPGYRVWPFVCGWIDTPAGRVPQVATRLDRSDLLGRWQMRWGLGRDRYRIAPGLYAVGRPDSEAPVLVTANYKLSFDALRRELAKLDAWILVLDTRGINVWCAAGKGTFGTEELVRRVKAVGLSRVVTHRRLILPQLGAPGIAAHQVAGGCGFRVIYGPVRASDLPAFLLADRQASPEMRRVSFTARERLILTPVELVTVGRVSLWILLGLLLLGGIGPGIFSFDAMLQRGGTAVAVYLAGAVAGAVVTPLLLPLIPGPAFSWKGAVVGAAVALAAVLAWGQDLGRPGSLALFLALPAVSSYWAMNFTGSTSYTSPSGVAYEMRRALPLQALAVVCAAIGWFWGAFA